MRCGEQQSRLGLAKAERAGNAKEGGTATALRQKSSNSACEEHRKPSASEGSMSSNDMAWGISIRYDCRGGTTRAKRHHRAMRNSDFIYLFIYLNNIII
jgi:hypothetical protein